MTGTTASTSASAGTTATATASSAAGLELEHGTWVRLRTTGEVLYFVGLDPSGRRVFTRRDGEMRVSSLLPVDAFEQLGKAFGGWDDGDNEILLDNSSVSSVSSGSLSYSIVLDSGDGSGFSSDDNEEGDGDDYWEGGDGDDEEAIWGIRKKYGHQHTLQVVCGTPAQVELDFPIASGWEIERLSD